MKRALLLLLALLLPLSACTPRLAVSAAVGGAPPIAAALGAPHLTLSGLTVTAHNPTGLRLAGQGGQGIAVTVDGVAITPQPGLTCDPPTTPRPGVLRYGCEVPGLSAGGTAALTFLATSVGGRIVDANGFGYLGASAVPVPLVLVR